MFMVEGLYATLGPFMKSIASFRIAALACCVPFTLAHADIPEYTQTQLQARSNLIVNDNGWNVPPGTSFNSISPAINDDQTVIFTAGLVPIDNDLSHNGAGLWYGSHATGSFVKIHDPGTDPDVSMIISDTPSINASGQVAYYTSLDGGTYQLWKYDPATQQSTTLSLLPMSPTSIANPDITDAGLIGFKANLPSGRALAAVSSGAPIAYTYDQGADPNSSYAYIYSPATDNDGRIASKVSTSDYSHNEIRLFSADGSSALIVADQATDASSPFASFDNGLDINAADSVAVAVKLVDGNVRAIQRFDADGNGGYMTTQIARVGIGPITELPSFSPSINANGLVAFRAKDADGDAIYVGDGASLKRIAGNGDVVQTDLGAAQLGQHDTSPVFSGKPAINARGDVAFVSGVYPQGNNQEEWGSGVFVAYVQDNDAIFEDGFEVTVFRR